MTELLVERAWVTEIDGHVLLTAAATAVRSMADYATRELAAEYEKAAGHDKLLHLTGKFVEAEKPNVNGAFWETADLDHGERTIVHSPVNFLHRSRHVIGTFTEAKLYGTNSVDSRVEAAAGGNPFIGVNAVAWPEFFPHECRLIEIASGNGRLFWSMECQSRTVRCETSRDGRLQGCGAEFPFVQVFGRPATVCAHLREKSSQRHFVEPRFNAGAVIVPPVRPGWPDARAEVLAKAEKLAEQTFREAASSNGYDDETLVLLMAKLTEFAGR